MILFAPTASAVGGKKVIFCKLYGGRYFEFFVKEQKKSVRIAGNFFRKKNEEASDLGTPMRVMLKELTRYGLRGGKWHRPALVRLVVRLMGKKLTPAINRASIACEMLHRFLLIHDDIMDQDLERHNGSTIQKVYMERFDDMRYQKPDDTYSLGMATVAGDLMHSWVFDLAVNSGLNDKIAANFVRGISTMSSETCAGWFLEAELKQLPMIKVGLPSVILADKLVSAHYSVLWPMRLGQLLSGRDYGDWMPELDTFGANLGLSFQIQDDILAIFGDQKETGKPVGNDLREAKKTLLTQYAYHQGKCY